MTPKEIEELATIEVKSSILQTDLLSQHIPEGDKEPSWDGNVYMYNNLKKKKDYFAGRVPVQVKGQVSKDFSKKQIKKTVKMNDLKSYLKDVGVVYFVVLISSDKKQKKIYFNALTPVKIKQLIADYGTQKSVKIFFSAFPESKTQKEIVFRDFFEHSRKQHSFVDSRLMTLEEAWSASSKEDVEIYTMLSIDTNQSPRAMATSFIGRELYFYLKKPNDEIVIPLNEWREVDEVTNVVSVSIKVNGKAFYNKVECVYEENQTVLKVGESFLITTQDIQEPIAVRFNIAPMLSDQLLDLTFLMELLAHKVVFVDDRPLNLGSANFNIDEEKINVFREELEYLQKIQKLLNVLHIHEDINMVALTSTEYDLLEILMSAFLDNEIVENLKQNLVGFLRVKIQQLTIELYFEKQEGEGEGCDYKIFDAFGKGTSLEIPSPDNKSIRVPSFFKFTKGDFLCLANVNYEELVEIYQQNFSIEVDEVRFTSAVLVLLELLKAYDVAHNIRVLNATIDFSKWLLDTCPLGVVDNTINYYQAVFRQRDLTAEERKKLWLLAEENKESLKIRFCVNALLKQAENARFCLESMTEKEQQYIEKLPIYAVYKDSAEHV